MAKIRKGWQQRVSGALGILDKSAKKQEYDATHTGDGKKIKIGLKVFILDDPTAQWVISEIEKKRDLLMCTATGDSPRGLYRELAVKRESRAELFKQLRIIQLDEWGSISKNHPATCEHFLQNNLLNPLEISPENFISFDSNPMKPEDECRRIQSELEREGPVDLCILGLGTNGHLGLIEPGSFVEPYCHVAKLSSESEQHGMLDSLVNKPPFGLTLGMQNILAARKILLLVTGKNKGEVLKRLIRGKVSTSLPASFLWLHSRVECLVDQSVPSRKPCR